MLENKIRHENIVSKEINNISGCRNCSFTLILRKHSLFPINMKTTILFIDVIKVTVSLKISKIFVFYYEFLHVNKKYINFSTDKEK